MQPISDAYNPYPDERWSNIRVVFELVDVDAAEDATPTVTSESEISKLEQTHNRVLETGKKLATLEHNYFLLDGTFELPSDDNGEVGWWSGEMSDSNGNINQVLEFNFTELQSSVGFMVIFDEKANQHASDFKIEIFDGSDSLVGEDNVVGNTLSRYISETPVDGYKRVKITFTKTSLPFRRIRVSEVVFGIIETFTGSNTTNLKLLYELSPSMEALPSNELSITIENAERKYNMINPQGIYRYLQQGQGLSVEVGVGGSRDTLEYANMGRFYFANSTAEDNAMTAQITAHDPLYALDRGLYRKGTNATATVSSIVSEVIADSGADISVSIPEAIASRVIGKNIPIVSHREALRMIAQAARSICYIGRDDVLTFRELSLAEPVDTLDNNNLYVPAKVNISEYINTVEANAVTYAKSQRDTSDVYEGTLSIAGTKEIWITYDAAQITSPTITGGTIDSADYYLYACRMTITATADVTLILTGYSLEERKTLYRAQNLEGNAESIKTVDNPLIRADFAQDFAEWVLATEQRRVSYALQERGNPAREITDTVKIYDAYGENRNAIIAKQEYQYDGTLKTNTVAWEGVE